MSKDKELVVGHYQSHNVLESEKVLTQEYLIDILKRLKRADEPKRSKRRKKSESKNKKGE